MEETSKMDWIEKIQKVFAAQDEINRQLAEDTLDVSDFSTDEYIEWIAEVIVEDFGKNSWTVALKGEEE